MKRTSLILAAASTAVLAGCVNLAPDYQRAPLPVPAGLPAETPAEASAALRWEDVIASPELKQAVALALSENRDLRATAARVRAARANLLLSRAALRPELGLSSTLQAGDTFDEGTSGAVSFSESGRVVFGASAWELDFFGRLRNLNEAALQEYLATEAGERAARISLAGAVAEAWMQLAADRALLDLANRTAESQSESLALTRELFAAGTASELDVRRASASVARAQAEAAQYEAAVRRDTNALQQLVGAPLPAGLLDSASLFPAPVRLGLPVGQSSEVLLERPDIQAAEASLKAGNAYIGAARAAYFPSITLTGQTGLASADLSDLFGGDGSSGWTFAPGINLPIFDFGRRRGNLEAARANAEAALAAYEGTIQQAFREVADAIAVSETINRRLAALEQLAEDTRVTLDLSRERFKSGLDGYLTVLDAQREHYSAQQQLILASLDNNLNGVALYKALGTWPGE